MGKQAPVMPSSSPSSGLRANGSDGILTETDVSQMTAAEFTKHCPSIGEIMAAIPAHCKERHLGTSTMLVVRDVVYISACATAQWYLLSVLPQEWALTRAMLWMIYVYWQGVFFFGIWILGHECGHGAFSVYSSVNDAVGLVLHSAVLVPYFSWQYSHGRHHKFTNHTSKGESHVPQLRSEVSEAAEIFYSMVNPVFMLITGFPLYLFRNVSGGRVDYMNVPYGDRKPSHYHPEGGLFPPFMKEKVLASVAGCGTTWAIMGFFAYHYGVVNVTLWYFLPYLMTNGWLVLYTSLQHTHSSVPHYGDEAFTYLRGALATVDRPPYGIFSHFHHEIGSTHVMHHIDAKIPCYHAVEATNAIKPVLGSLYREDNTPIFKALLKACRECKYMEGLDGVQFYSPGPPEGKKMRKLA